MVSLEIWFLACHYVNDLEGITLIFLGIQPFLEQFKNCFSNFFIKKLKEGIVAQ